MIDVFHLLCQLVHRIRLPSLEDDTGDTRIIALHRIARPSVHFPSTLTTEPGKEKFVDGSHTNELCVTQNGVSTCSNSLKPPLPATPHVDGKDTSAKPSEDKRDWNFTFHCLWKEKNVHSAHYVMPLCGEIYTRRYWKLVEECNNAILKWSW